MPIVHVDSVAGARTALAGLPSPVVAIPVYNSFEDTVRCYESVLAHTPTTHGVLVVDDAGADRSPIEILDKVADRLHPRFGFTSKLPSCPFPGSLVVNEEALQPSSGCRFEAVAESGRPEPSGQCGGIAGLATQAEHQSTWPTAEPSGCFALRQGHQQFANIHDLVDIERACQALLTAASKLAGHQRNRDP
jgi:hypothetical protein